MKLVDLEVATSTVVALATAFLGVSGYLSVRFQANVLGFPHGVLASNWSHVLQAGEFAAVVLLLLLLASIVAIVVAAAGLVVRRAFPSIAQIAGRSCSRLANSIYFAAFAVTGISLAAMGAILSVMQVRQDQAVGPLSPLANDLALACIFLLCFSLLLVCLGLAVFYSKLPTREPAAQRRWLWRMAVPSIILLALVLPIAYGGGVRPRTFVAVKVIQLADPANAVCGLLVERNDERAAFWTVVSNDAGLIGVIQDVSLEGTTLQLGQIADLGERIDAVLASRDPKVLCRSVNRVAP